MLTYSGRGAFCSAAKVCTVRYAGAYRRENVGMSSDKTGEKPVRRKPKVSTGRVIRGGLVGP